MPKKGYKQSEEHKKKHSETTKGITNSGGFKKGHNKSVNCDWIEGDKSHHWKGGRFVNSEGYVFILSPNHPYRTKLE